MNKIVRHFRMGPMLLKDSVSRRISSEYGMCCTEFMYQVFQAYDWYHLYKTYDCKFQVINRIYIFAILLHTINF